MLKVDINILFTVINLLLLFFVIWKFLFKPVKKVIAKRQEEVQKSYDEAEKVKAEAEAIKAEYEENIKNVEGEKAAILRETRVQANDEYNKIIKDAQDEASGIIETAKRDAKEASDKLRKKANEDISDLLTEAVSKIALTKQDPEADRRLFDDFLSKSGE